MRALLLAILLLSPAARAESVGLPELRECLGALHGVESRYLSMVPADIIALDRNLHLFKLGIPFLEQNARLLEERAIVGYRDDFLLGNAVAGCEQYRAQFEGRAKFFAGFVLCVLLTLVALTLYFFVFILPSSRGKAAQNAKGPQDVPVSNSKSL